ncbi:hypothetical protein V2J09_016411 [Rumex salicifolius]
MIADYEDFAIWFGLIPRTENTRMVAMGEKLPKTILTHQDVAMSMALASQWPRINHRLCIWHIFQNATTHLAHLFSRDKGFSKDLSDCVYGYEHEEKWTMVHGKDTFSSDKTTTQRSESINAMIKHQRLHDDHHYDEMVIDFKTSQSKVVLAFHVKILKHVASIYTPMVYKLFEEELCKAFDCKLEIYDKIDS